LFNTSFDNEATQKWLNKYSSQLPKIGGNAVNRTSVFGLNEVKGSNGVSKKGGDLRSSYKIQKNSPISHTIFSPLKYADGVESGYEKHDVVPKAGHTFLTIPLHPNVRTKKGIKKSAMNRLFKNIGYSKHAKKLYTKGDLKDNTVKEVFDFVGVALARKVTIPKYGGTHKIRDIILPKIDKFFNKEVNFIMEKLA